MHPTLQAFADRYRHAFPDLVITTTPDGEDLRLEWQEGPEMPCYAVEVYVSSTTGTVFDYAGGFIDANGVDLLDVAILALSREREISDNPGPILAAPGTFGALVKERRLLRDSPAFASPDRLS
jgi:hypothetical protein